MSVGYVDSSCMVAALFGEPGHEAIIARLAESDQVLSSNLLEAELRSAIRREGVEGDLGFLGSLGWVLPDRPLTEEIQAILAVGYLRGTELWHLACALYLSPDPAELAFITVDRQQAAIAAAVGFRVVQADAPTS